MLSYDFVPKPLLVSKGKKSGWSCLCEGVLHKDEDAAFNHLIEDLVNEFADTVGKPRSELLLEVKYQEMFLHQRAGAALKRRGVSVSGYRQYLDQTFFYSALGEVMQHYRYDYRKNKVVGSDND